MAKKAKKKTYKLDLYKEVLPNIRNGNITYYDNLSEKEKTDFPFYVLMLNILGSNSEVHIMFLNTFINPVLFDYQKNHREMLYRLFIICTPPASVRMRCVKRYSRKNSKSIGVIKDYFDYSTADALEVFPLLSNDQIIELAKDIGRQQKEITALKRELKSRC